MKFRNRTISSNQSLLEAFKKMDTLDKKLFLVLNGDVFVGLLTAGDIQRAIIQNKPLDTSVSEVLRTNIRVARPNESFDIVKQMMFDYRMELCPVVSDNGDIVDVYFWEDIFMEIKPQPQKQFTLPIVVMAGGKGTRLKPITNVLPKPLIPIGDKSIIEEIFDRFSFHGCNDFFISVNYKADFIEYYLGEQNLPYNLTFFTEDKPMGTAGSLSLLKDKINQTFIVSNCDIIIEQDYSEILDYHRTNKNEITVVAALKNFPLPYGTIETGENGHLLELKEKPELTFKINSGMYILEPHLLDEIPQDEFFHITHLIENIKNRRGRVGVFPVSEKSWKDIGEWDVYLENTNAI
ncbi:nucleotidyltransferase family protein [Ancylomarina sp. DW003]|nr:nucleotidyltransferase family protein [Ancylomarina sp. DW003]MDE5421909.1 nucleotidyltransferase family protein [Ancylomarina sp. DW003]